MYSALASRKAHHVWESGKESGAGQWESLLSLRKLRIVVPPMFRPWPPGEVRVTECSAENLFRVRRNSSDSKALFVPVDSVSGSADENDNAAIPKLCDLVWRQYQNSIQVEERCSDPPRHAESESSNDGLADQAEKYERHLIQYGLC